MFQTVIDFINQAQVSTATGMLITLVSVVIAYQLQKKGYKVNSKSVRNIIKNVVAIQNNVKATIKEVSGDDELTIEEASSLLNDATKMILKNFSNLNVGNDLTIEDIHSAIEGEVKVSKKRYKDR